MIINDGQSKQNIIIPYSHNELDRIAHIKQICQDQIGINNSVLLRDQFGNVLLENLDIIRALYPFYNFCIKGQEPQVTVVYPYGFDKTQYYKATKSNRKLTLEHNR